MATRLTKNSRTAFIRAVVDDIPTVDYDEKMRIALQKFAVSVMPAKLRALYKEFANHFEHSTAWTNAGFSNVTVVSPSREAFEQAIERDEAITLTIRQLSADRLEQEERIDGLRDKVHALAFSVNTVEALLEAAPDMAKYISSRGDVLDRTVPVVTNLVQELHSAGWPKQ